MDAQGSQKKMQEQLAELLRQLKDSEASKAELERRMDAQLAETRQLQSKLHALEKQPVSSTSIFCVPQHSLQLNIRIFYCTVK